MAASDVPIRKPDVPWLSAACPHERGPAACAVLASHAAAASAPKTSAVPPIRDNPRPQLTDARYEQHAPATKIQKAIVTPVERAWSSPASTRTPRITTDNVRKKRGGTSSRALRRHASSMPNASRTAKLAKT